MYPLFSWREPAPPSAQAAHCPRPIPRSSSSRTRWTTLIAYLIRAVFASRAPGAHVDLVESGGAALPYFKAASPDELPDVVILDLGLPDISGFEVLEWISERRELKDLPVLVFSTSTDPKAVERAYALGARLYREKPADFAVLVDEVREFLGRWRGGSQEEKA